MKRKNSERFTKSALKSTGNARHSGQQRSQNSNKENDMKVLRRRWFFLGAIAGFGAAYFMDKQNGVQRRTAAKETLNKYQTALNDFLALPQVKSAKESVTGLVSKAKDFISPMGHSDLHTPISSQRTGAASHRPSTQLGEQKIDAEIATRTMEGRKIISRDEVEDAFRKSV
jgi:hypothetical protein